MWIRLSLGFICSLSVLHFESRTKAGTGSSLLSILNGLAESVLRPVRTGSAPTDQSTTFIRMYLHTYLPTYLGTYLRMYE
jgi:hypothetical protein